MYFDILDEGTHIYNKSMATIETGLPHTLPTDAMEANIVSERVNSVMKAKRKQNFDEDETDGRQQIKAARLKIDDEARETKIMGLQTLTLMLKLPNQTKRQ